LTIPGHVTVPPEYRDRYRVVEEIVEVGGTRFAIARPRDAEALINEEDFARDERLPYWAELWPSALALGAHVLAMDGHGRSAVELGCGVGLVSTCAGRAGFHVTATDYYDDALVFCAANAIANTGIPCTTRLADWRSLPDDLGTFDTILAADVLYERPYGPLVARAIGSLLAPHGTAWVADPGRVGVEPFLKEAASIGLAPRVHQPRQVTAFARSHDITLIELTVSA
jgi:predicted nicotinamide N-methyase